MPIPWNVWHIWNASWWGSPIKHLSGSFGKWVSEWETWVVPSVFSVTQLLHSHARHLCGVQKAFLPGCLQDGVGNVLQMRFTWEEYCPLRQLLQCVQHWWLLHLLSCGFAFPKGEYTSFEQNAHSRHQRMSGEMFDTTLNVFSVFPSLSPSLYLTEVLRAKNQPVGPAERHSVITGTSQNPH